MSTASPQVLTGAVRIAACKRNLALFMCEILRMEIGDHHVAWAAAVDTHMRLDVEAGRGIGKSATFSFGYPIWKSWRRNKQNGLISSNTQSQTEEFLRIIKDGKEFRDEATGIVFKMPKLIDTELSYLVPKDFERSWTGSKVEFTNGSRFIGRSMGSKVRGFHGNWIVVDDPHSREAGFSELSRDRACAYIYADLMPMLLPGAQMVIVGTPFHKDDIHGRNSRNPDWYHQKFPAMSFEANGTPVALWPELRPVSWLEAQRRTMSSILFDQEYLLKPASNESSLFPASLFRSRPETLADWLTLRPTDAQMKARDEWLYFGGVDLAMSAATSADNTVIIVLGVDPLGSMHIVELVREHGMPYHEQLKLIADTLAPYNNSGRLASVFVEANQMQRIFGDEMQRLTALPIRKFTTNNEKNDLARGVPSLRMYLENGKLRIPRGDARSRDMTDILLSELQAFAWLNGKMQGVGAHDDTVMALWIATLAVRKGAGIAFFTIDLDTPLDLPSEGEEAAASKPWMPYPTEPDDPATLDGEAGLALMVRRGYVPKTCSLAPVDGAHYVMAQVRAHRSPCWTCNAPRSDCGGLPLNIAASERAVAPTTIREPKPKATRERARRPEESPALKPWLAVVEACGGDERLARSIPETPQERARGYNALALGGTAPEWVATAVAQGKGDALYDALERLTGGQQ